MTASPQHPNESHDHDHNYVLATHWEPKDPHDPETIFKSIFLCECGAWKSAKHSMENNEDD